MNLVGTASANRRVLRTAFAAVLVFSCRGAYADHDPPPDVPIQQWLQGKDRRDFDWKVEVERPYLTFQQRHLQKIHTTLSVGKLLKAGVSLTDLHFVVKFADDKGNWFPGQCYSHFLPTPDLGPGDDIHSFASAYLRPGKYQVAVMAYDSFNRRGNFWKSHFEVPGIKDDPLPDIDRDLPQIDFLPDVQHLDLKVNPRPQSVDSVEMFLGHYQSVDSFALGEGTLRLPIATKSPVLLDVIVDFHPAILWGSARLHWNAAVLMQISQVLSQLGAKNGCVHFSAINLMQQKTYLHREEADTVAWNKLQKLLEETEHNNQANRNIVDVRTLAGPKPAPDHFARFLEKVLASTDTCDAQPQPLRHVLIVVSDALPFFNSNMESAEVRPESFPGVETYHLELDQSSGGVRSDQMVSVLKSLHPVEFRFSHATQFRHALARVISGIEKPPENVGHSPGIP